MTQPFPPPCPPPGSLEQMQEIIEAQSRTISHLLANYDALLAKVEGEGLPFKWGTGTPTAFAAAAVIPGGWWIMAATTPPPGTAPTVTVNNFNGGTVTITPQVGVPFFSDGTAVAVAAFTGVPVTATL